MIRFFYDISPNMEGLAVRKMNTVQFDGVHIYSHCPVIYKYFEASISFAAKVRNYRFSGKGRGIIELFATD